MGGKLFKGESVKIKTGEVPEATKHIRSIVPFECCTLVGGIQADIIKKEEHGDLDFVVLAPGNFNPEDLLKHPDVEKCSLNGYVKSYLIDVPRIGKCHIDLLWTTSREDYELKVTYHQGGTATARFVGQLARSLGYKWTSEGFFKHVQDARGNYHHFLMTKDLMVGMHILGLDVATYEEGLAFKSAKHFIQWITKSPRCFPSKWKQAHHHTHRKTLKQKEDWIKEIHEALDEYEVEEEPEDDAAYWNSFAGDDIEERLEVFLEAISIIEKPVFNGRQVMALGIKQGPIIGKILQELTKRFPDGTDEETFKEQALLIAKEEGELV